MKMSTVSKCRAARPALRTLGRGRARGSRRNAPLQRFARCRHPRRAALLHRLVRSAALPGKADRTLEAGKRADIAVWDHNPYSIPSADLKKLKCEMTIVDGKTVYSSPE